MLYDNRYKLNENSEKEFMVQFNVYLEGKTVLVTGAAAFIGSNLVKRIFKEFKNVRVVGLD